MKKYFSVIVIVLVAICSFGQSTAEWCGSDQLIQKQFLNDPSLKEVFHQQMMAAAKSRHTNVGNRATIVVPVVVHIIHDNGQGNISDEQIQSALDVLNLDYNRMNADTNVTRNTLDAPFKHQAGSMDVEFKLARLDPNGDCTNGIVRVNAPSLTYNADEDCKYSSNGGSDQWPRTEYFNIWIVNSIDNGGASGITLGYAYLPYGGAGGDGYGILMRHDSFGIIETAAGSDGRTLTHEMGHALGLNHIFNAGWGPGATGCHTTACDSNGDYACDTPPQTEANWSCSQIWNSCSAVPTGDTYGFDVLDQIENYMSYNACQNMFSLDQVGIMQENFVSISFLSSLSSPANLDNTGVNDPDELCKADFEVLNRSICSGTIVDFNDFSFHNPTSWTWTISGNEGSDYNYVNGTNASSQEPSVEFITSGSYDVQLVVSDGVSTITESKVDYITVIPQPNSIDLIEGFEGYTSFGTTGQWSVYNASGNGFEVVEGISRTGWRSARLPNFGQAAGNSDELISAPVDLSVINPATESVTLSFRYSYKKRFESNTEWLKVFITNTCGETWVQRKTLQGSQISPLVQNSSWVPTQQSDWTTVHMTNITSGYFVENFRYKFEFESDNGNNFYLDDINIYKGAPSDVLVGLDDNGNLIESMSVYPNPTAGNVNIRFAVVNGGAAIVTVTDLTGKQLEAHQLFAASGNNLLELNTANYASGVYFIQLNLGGIVRVEQLIVE